MAQPMHRNDTGSVTTTSLLHSILNWLRAGYPDGVPGPDNVQRVAAKLAAAGWPLHGVDHAAI